MVLRIIGNSVHAFEQEKKIVGYNLSKCEDV